MYGQCRTFPLGSYIGHQITKLPWGLALTSMYNQCITYPHGSYIGPWIAKSPILGSYKIMANTSIIYTDKTGTFTQNVMSVIASSISIHAKFVRNLRENKAHTNIPDQEQEPIQEQDLTDADEPQVNRKYADDFSIEQSDINTVSSPSSST